MFINCSLLDLKNSVQLSVAYPVEHVLKSMKFYQNTYPDDACIVVTDTNTVLTYLPGENIDFKMNVGDSVEKYQGTVAYKALISGKKLREERIQKLMVLPALPQQLP